MMMSLLWRCYTVSILCLLGILKLPTFVQPLALTSLACGPGGSSAAGSIPTTVATKSSTTASTTTAAISQNRLHLSATPSRTPPSRRDFFTSAVSSVVVAAAATTISPQVSNAADSTTTPTRYILNEETGDYEPVVDKDWQTEWKERLDKAQSMSTDEVFMAARGASNRPVDGDVNESNASKKRRAMAGCRDKKLLEKSGLADVKVCTARVLQGDIDFMLSVM